MSEGTTGSYTYRVQACNGSGCSAFRTSGAVSVTIKPASAPSLTVPTSSTGSYTVSWGAVSGATGYTLQQQINGGSWSTAYSGSARSKAFDQGNGTYGYRVQACNAGGCSGWSAVDSVTVVVIPGTPGTPNVTYSGPRYRPIVAVSWSAVANATSYELEQTHPQDGVSIVYRGTGISWSQLVLASGTVKYRVRACSSAGCSAYSYYDWVILDSGLALSTAATSESAAIAPDREAKDGSPTATDAGNAVAAQDTTAEGEASHD